MSTLNAVLEPASDEELIASSDLFDADWYRRTQALDLPPSMSPASHFLRFGAERGLDPGPLFDGTAYRLEYGDVLPSENPVLHHLRLAEAGRGRRIRPVLDQADIHAVEQSVLFDAAWYRATQAPDLPPQLSAAWHLLQFGTERGLDPGPLFDSAAYRFEHGDVPADLHALRYHLHWLDAGGTGRTIRPVLDHADIVSIAESPFFDPDWYRATQVPDLPIHYSPAWHFLQFGTADDLDPGPLFDSTAYRIDDADVPDGGNVLLHHIRFVAAGGSDRLVRPVPDPADVEALAKSELFDAAWYRVTQASDLPSGKPAAWHYLQFGSERGLDPGPSFDAKAYTLEHGDVAAGGNPLLHHLHLTDAGQGRRIRPVLDHTDVLEIQNSDLFDPSWYLATQAPDLPSWVPAAWHYLQFGAEQGFNPGPLFDAAFYLRMSPYVEAFGSNPLLHYFRNGRAERRPMRNVNARSTDPSRPLLAVSVPPTTPDIVPVAVVVHAFYPELFAEIAERLRHLSTLYTLLVAVPDESGASVVKQAIAAAGLQPMRLLCKVVPNRGRNFATLLAAFAREVLSCKLVLHLHTKRSLYTGIDRADWRRSLYDGLIGSRSLTLIILGLFDRTDKLGLVYAAPLPDLPYWAHHWLSNEHLAPGLFTRLGVDDFTRSGYFDYPVGGMFWARVDALRPLLQAEFAFDDFPVEAGQTDGTISHTIERAVGLVSKALGYCFIEIDAGTGTFRDSWSTRNLDQYRHTSLAGFERLLDGVDLVSFDIFDTLVSRPALKPDSVLRYVGHQLAQDEPALSDFFVRRKAAEAEARARKDHRGDVDLDEIYGAFALEGAWTSTTVATAANEERRIDRRIMRARPGAIPMLQLARNAGRRVIAISDTYYTQEDIAALLNACGIDPGDFAAIYLSSEQGARKDRGDLWLRARELERVAPTRWLHVGDNEKSDIQAACDAGLRFFHVMTPSVLAELEGMERSHEPDEERWAADLVVGPALLRMAGSPFMTGRPFGAMPLQDARDVGFTVFGPTMFTFMAWLIRHPALRHAGHLFFLAREGHLLYRLYAAIRERFPALDLPAATYFYASRRSSLSAAQAVSYDPEQIIAGASFRGTLQELLRARVGLDLPAVFEAGDWPIVLPDDAGEVMAALNALEEPLVMHAHSEAVGLATYARGAGMGAADATGRLSAVVDIGYSATIQKNLQTVLGVPLIGFYMGTYAPAQDVEKPGGHAFGCFSHDVIPWTSEAPVLKYSLLMEAFLTAPHGQLLSVMDGVPVFKKHTMDDQRAALLEELHQGAADYCQQLLDLYGPALLNADIEQLQPQQPLAMLGQRKLRLPAELTGFFTVEDDYCGNNEIAIDL